MKHTITVFLFSAQQIVFGAYAEQVEKLLKAEDVIGTELFDKECRVLHNTKELEIVDFSQRLRLNERPEKARRGEELSGGSALCEPKTHVVSPLESSPKILIVKPGMAGAARGIYIEYPQELRSLPVECIHRLPLLMRKKNRMRAIWGIALVEEGPIVLVDLEQV